MEKNTSVKLMIRSLIVASICFVIVYILNLTGVFNYLEYKTYDSRMKSTAGKFHTSDEITLIVVDQESINWAKEEKGWGWPWPREAYGHIVDFLSEGNASSIAFDIIFSEPSLYGNNDDISFGESERKSGKVIQTLFFDGDTVTYPVPEINDNAAIIGNITSCMDSDDVIRRARVYFDYNGKKYPSLGFASLELTGDDFSSIKTDKDGAVLIRYPKSSDDYYTVNAKTILQSYDAWINGTEGDFVPSDFEGTYSFVAYYAPGLFDICSTPVAQTFPGVGVHIAALDSFLNDTFITKINFLISLLFILFLSFFGSLVVAFVESQARGRYKIVFLSLGLILGLAISSVIPFVLFVQNIWIELIAPLVAFISSYIISLALNYIIEGKQKRFIKSAFSQYLSPAVIEQLVDNPDKLTLGGERREISIYFSDVQGFTSISEKLTPQKLTEVLNYYLSEMSSIIMESGGTIDKYEGDAIIAFWNAPLDEEDHAKRILSAAMKCQMRLTELREELEKLSGSKMYQRIGMNTGYAVVGNMGSSARFDYTMLGDSVNLASRLEGLNKQFGTYTMCSEATMNAALKYGCDLKFRKLANVAVVGKKEPVVVYEPMFEDVFNSKKEQIEIFDKGRDIFYQGNFTEALKIFESKEDIDPPCHFYAEKCRRFIQTPPEHFEGVWVATEK